MQYINDFKRLIFTNQSDLQRRRLCITNDDLDSHWTSMTLSEMARTFTVADDYITSFVISQLLQPYLSTRKVTHQAFVVCKPSDKGEELPVMYVYDCKIFRSSVYTREENELISAFLLIYREAIPVEEPVYEVTEPWRIEPGHWILRVKQSALLKTYTLLRDTFQKLPQSNDKIVLQESQYFDFMQEWIKCYYNYNLEITISNFFRGILALLENQLLAGYFSKLSQQQRHERMYKRPVRVISKPRNIEQFTLTEKHFGEIKWQTLKVVAYRLKYHIVEQFDSYQCFREQQQEEQSNQTEEISMEDKMILAGFNLLRRFEEEYENYSLSA